MKRIEITINGTAYPCSPTMGAMLRFKEQTGREITQIDPSSLSDLCTYLWCCVKAGAKREGKEFRAEEKRNRDLRGESVQRDRI